MKRKILFLLPYPLNQAPSQRFRVEAYFPLLAEQQLSFDTNEFLDEAAWKILYKKGATLKKVWAIFGGYIKRLALVLFSVGRYEYIFIHREAAPLGPPIFEWWLAKVQRKKIIYDFDDAIWIPNVSESNRIVSFLKCFWKVKWICRWSHKISAGNDFLSHYSSRFNTNVVLNPTCVD